MAKSSKERASELILKLDFKSVLLVLDMISLKGTQLSFSMSSFLLVFVVDIPNHTTISQAVCWALMDIILNPQGKHSSQACFFPFYRNGNM